MSEPSITVPITNPDSEALLLINNVITGLAEAAKEAAKQRTEERYALQTKVFLGSKEGADQFKPTSEVWGEDLSNTGIGLISTRPFEKNQKCYLMMKPAKSPPIFARIHIRRCYAITSSIYRIGATFIYDDPKTPA